MKRIFACLLSLGLIGSLSACGAADTAATSAATSAAASVSSVSAAESVSAASGADSASASASASASSSASTSSSASASSSDVAAGVSNVPVVDISSEDKDLTGDDGTTALVTTTTPTVSVTIDGNDAAAAAIQEDIDAQIATFTDSLTETLSWAKDDYDSRSSADQQTWTPYGATLEVTLERCDEQVLSLLFSSYSYTGGAHGLTDLSARNYDVSTGDVLTLSTLSADGGETLTDTCANSVLEQGESSRRKTRSMTTGKMSWTISSTTTAFTSAIRAWCLSPTTRSLPPTQSAPSSLPSLTPT